MSHFHIRLVHLPLVWSFLHFPFYIFEKFRKQIYFLRNAGSDWWVKSTGHHTTNPGRSKSSCSTFVLSSPYRCPFVSVWRYFYFAFYGEKLQQSYLGCWFHFGFWPPAIPLPFQTLKEMVQASTRIQH